jgi:hypothetical protein
VSVAHVLEELVATTRRLATEETGTRLALVGALLLLLLEHLVEQIACQLQTSDAILGQNVTEQIVELVRLIGASRVGGANLRRNCSERHAQQTFLPVEQITRKSRDFVTIADDLWIVCE